MTSTQAPLAARRNERTLQLLHRLVLPLDRALQAADRQSGCSAAQLSALSAIRYLDKATVTAIAAHEAIAPPTASRIVESLVGAGLATRQVEPGDRRTSQLAVTEAGQRAIELACDARAEVLAGILRDLDETEWRALRTAAEALNRVFGYVPLQAGSEPTGLNEK